MAGGPSSPSTIELFRKGRMILDRRISNCPLHRTVFEPDFGLVPVVFLFGVGAAIYKPAFRKAE